MNELNHKKHNNFFLSSMSNKKVAKEFLERHLPVYAKKEIDLDSLKLRKESYIDKELKMSQVDVLYEVKFKKDTKPGFIYCLLEHQSTCDRAMAFRILKYMVKIMDDHVKNQDSIKLPIILPIVFYHGKGSYTSTNYLFDLFCENKELAENIFLKPFTLIEVSQIPDDELMRYPYSGTVEFIFKHIFAREILVFLEKIKPRKSS